MFKKTSIAPPLFASKVTLRDVQPRILRRIEVPADIKIDQLHRTLQAALGWTNGHLVDFRQDWGRN